jgi:hypothetical protein
MPDVPKRRIPLDRHDRNLPRLSRLPPSKKIKSGPTAGHDSLCSSNLPIPPSSETSPVECELEPGHKTLHDDFLWTFDHIKRIKDDRCQISWTDSILSGKQLSHGVLHGKGLREHAECVEAQNNGLFRVTWHPTWEPVKDWIHHLHDMSHDSRFQRKVYTGVVHGFVTECYPPCVVHRSLLSSTFLGSRPLIEEMVSCAPVHPHHDGDGDGDGDGDLLEITWRPHWTEAI